MKPYQLMTFVTSNFETLENYIAKLKSLIKMYEELSEKIKTPKTAGLLTKVKTIEELYKNLKIDFILEDIEELCNDSKVV